MITEYNTNRRWSSVISKLISETKEEKLIWYQMSELKDYLENDGIHLQKIDLFQSCLRFTKSQRFFPIISRSFISFCENKNIVYFLSQDLRTRAINLYYVYLDNRSMSWRILHADQVDLNRLYNIICLIAPHDSAEEYADFLYSINDVRV